MERLTHQAELPGNGKGRGDQTNEFSIRIARFAGLSEALRRAEGARDKGRGSPGAAGLPGLSAELAAQTNSPAARPGPAAGVRVSLTGGC